MSFKKVLLAFFIIFAVERVAIFAIINPLARSSAIQHLEFRSNIFEGRSGPSLLSDTVCESYLVLLIHRYQLCLVRLNHLPDDDREERYRVILVGATPYLSFVPSSYPDRRVWDGEAIYGLNSAFDIVRTDFQLKSEF